MISRRANPLPCWRIWRWPLVLCLAVIAAGCSQGGRGTAERNETVELYINAAFSPLPEGAPLGAEPVLFKRRPGPPVKVLVTLGGAARGTQSEILGLYDEVGTVLSDMADHSDHFAFQLYSPEQLVSLVSSGERAFQDEVRNNILVLVGSTRDLDDWLMLSREDIGIKAIIDWVPTAKSDAMRKGLPLCFAFNFVRSDDPTILGTTFVYVEKTNRRAECLYHNLMGATGLMGGLPAKAQGLLNGRGIYDRPTPLDWTMWRMHLDPRLSSGMRPDDVRGIAPAIVEDLKRPATDSASLVHPQVLLDDGQHFL